MSHPILDKIPIVVIILIFLIALILLSCGLSSFNDSMVHSLYPITYESVEVTITERVGVNQYCGYLVSDVGTRYYACNDMFWGTPPNNRYSFQYAYNYSTSETALTMGKTIPVLVNISRVTRQ